VERARGNIGIDLVVRELHTLRVGANLLINSNAEITGSGRFALGAGRSVMTSVHARSRIATKVWRGRGAAWGAESWVLNWIAGQLISSLLPPTQPHQRCHVWAQ
jgi:hypothetical protein